jgi:hypothetical protein
MKDELTVRQHALQLCLAGRSVLDPAQAWLRKGWGR